MNNIKQHYIVIIFLLIVASSALLTVYNPSKIFIKTPDLEVEISK